MNNLFVVEKQIRKLKNFDEIPEYLLNIEIVDDDDRRPVVSFMITGPEDTAYEGLVFTIKLIFENKYPKYPPIVKFITKCYHPNIDDQNGKICLNSMSDDWSPKTNISLIIWMMWEFLRDPNPDSPLNRKAAKHYEHNYEKFKRRVEEWVEYEY